MWKLLRIWDYFIIDGWKTVFKTSVLIMQQNENQLLDMNFEQMLSQMPTL